MTALKVLTSAEYSVLYEGTVVPNETYTVWAYAQRTMEKRAMSITRLAVASAIVWTKCSTWGSRKRRKEKSLSQVKRLLKPLS